MRKLLFILILVVVGSVQSGAQKVQWHPAVSLCPNWGGELVSFAEVAVFDGEIIEIKYLTRPDFILMVSGCRQSKANPDGKDLFAEYGVEKCGCRDAEDGQIYSDQCGTVENLWKLRFGKYPYPGDAGMGWANYDTGPDERQRNLLQEFGIVHLSDFAWGDNCMRLIASTANPSWVSTYD